MGLLDEVDTFYHREISLEPHDKGYMVVCLSNNDDVADDFELEIFSSAALDIKPNSNLLEDFKYKNEQDGNWNSETCGGSTAERGFTKNHFYLLSVTQPSTQLFLQLESKASSPVGIYLFKTQKTNLNDLDQSEIDSGVATTMFVMKNNTLFFDCGNQAGNFMVVPCAYNRIDDADFKLKINASKQIEIKPGMNKGYPVRKDYQIQTITCAQYSTTTTQPIHSM